MHDRPLDLSFYLLVRTKEKMVLEAKLKKLRAVGNPEFHKFKNNSTESDSNEVAASQ